ncbi:hypothetical protein HPB50_017291 [Hyalomma asiaticum]|uniref:Uncharacterized protein n=1 Tax=Hyalomma asiaticum TaxID=266040 RepID=A0ACB7RNY5_HYAAI|nr:hypothetical protein HPB50_017291 [Hyalomma asiaticum]
MDGAVGMRAPPVTGADATASSSTVLLCFAGAPPQHPGKIDILIVTRSSGTEDSHPAAVPLSLPSGRGSGSCNAGTPMACLQQTVTTAPAPAATAASAVDQGNATSTQLANASDCERDSMDVPRRRCTGAS